MSKRITFEQVAAEVAKLDTNQDNPTVPSSTAVPRCVYTHPKTGQHCIAGQIIEQLGGTLPSVDHVDNGRAIRDLAENGRVFGLAFDGDALELLATLQNDADWVTNLDAHMRATSVPDSTAWQYAVEHNLYLRAKDIR